MLPVRKPLPAALLLALWVAPGALFGVAAEGRIYQWTDERGQVTYSDKPPPAGAEAREVEVHPEPGAEAVEAARERTESLEQLSDEFAEEHRQREQEAAAAGAERPAEPPPVEPPAESRYDSSYPYPIRPGQPAQLPVEPPSLPPRAPEFQPPRNPGFHR
jgi:hypothetical protein